MGVLGAQRGMHSGGSYRWVVLCYIYDTARMASSDLQEV